MLNPLTMIALYLIIGWYARRVSDTFKSGFIAALITPIVFKMIQALTIFVYILFYKH